MSADHPGLIRVLDATLGYGSRPVLSGVNLEICAGEFWFFLGPNGSGKTTLLRALLGLLAPTSGAIESDLLERREMLGFVPQRCELNPALPTTVREFVSLGMVGTRVPRSNRPAELARALSQSGLAGMERASYGALSGGQRQRALVARAMVRRPEVLMLDEPTAGLDPITEDSILQTLAALNERDGVTVVFVSHQVATAARYASHAALFRDGRVTSGTRAEVFRAEVLSDVYGAAVPSTGVRFEEGGS